MTSADENHQDVEALREENRAPCEELAQRRRGWLQRLLGRGALPAATDTEAAARVGDSGALFSVQTVPAANTSRACSRR